MPGLRGLHAGVVHDLDPLRRGIWQDIAMKENVEFIKYSL